MFQHTLYSSTFLSLNISYKTVNHFPRYCWCILIKIFLLLFVRLSNKDYREKDWIHTILVITGFESRSVFELVPKSRDEFNFSWKFSFNNYCLNVALRNGSHNKFVTVGGVCVHHHVREVSSSMSTEKHPTRNNCPPSPRYFVKHIQYETQLLIQKYIKYFEILGILM